MLILVTIQLIMKSMFFNYIPQMSLKMLVVWEDWLNAMMFQVDLLSGLVHLGTIGENRDKRQASWNEHEMTGLLIKLVRDVMFVKLPDTQTEDHAQKMKQQQWRAVLHNLLKTATLNNFSRYEDFRIDLYSILCTFKS